jgi:hypothetical protein
MPILAAVEEPKRMELSAEVFKYWVIDRRLKQVRIIMQTGEEISEPIADDDPILQSEVALSIFDWENWWITSVTKRNNLVNAEGYNPLGEDPLGGRPVVYLDQNHWRTVAQARINPDALRKRSEIEPALELAYLGSDAGVVLPLSSAHFVETAPLYGDLRYNVGIAMARLSGGWQMRHPSQVLRHEAVRMVARELGLQAPPTASVPVMTLEPHALLDDGVDAFLMDPADHKLFIAALTNPGLMVDLLLDPNSDPKTPVPSWVEWNQAVTDQFATAEMSVQEKRRAAYMRVWADHTEPLRRALAELEREIDDLAHLTANDIPRLYDQEPMLAYLTRMYTRRYMDKNTRWKSNDLTDMTFLACAAGYADYVAAENHTGTQLQQIQRSMGRPITVHRSLEALVEQIRADGVQSAEERSSAS